MARPIRRFTLPIFLRLWLPLAALATVPVLTDWLKNRHEASAIDLGISLVIALLASLLIAALFRKSYGRAPFPAYLGATLVILVAGQRFSDRVDAVLPLIRAIDPLPLADTGERLFAALVFFAVLILACAWIGKAVTKVILARGGKPADFAGAITVMIAVTFLLQFSTAARFLIPSLPQSFYRPKPLSPQAPALAQGAAKPDIYYIVLDRYASSQTLSTQFNYDNSPFTGFLEANGYYVNPTAHGNYPYTTMSVSSTLTANYHDDLIQQFNKSSAQTITPYHDSIRYSPVIQQLKTLGYSYYHLGSWYEASNQAPLADYYYQPEGQLTIFGKRLTLNGFSKDELLHSLFDPLVEHGLHIGSFSLLSYSSQSEADGTLSKLATLKQLAQAPSGGRFIFAHILVPHEPYIFNADGSQALNTDSNDVGEPVKQKYLGQVQFISDQMKGIVSQINKESDGKAIVVLQADEGPYPTSLNSGDFAGINGDEELASGNMLDWSDADLQMKYGILAAYHIPQASTDQLAAGADSVNVFRLILNTYFNDTLPYLPRCTYAYENGKEKAFDYVDITKRLTGAECKRST